MKNEISYNVIFIIVKVRTKYSEVYVNLASSQSCRLCFV